MGNFKYEGDKIILNYGQENQEIYKLQITPIYRVGTIYFEYNGERYFLEK